MKRHFYNLVKSMGVKISGLLDKEVDFVEEQEAMQRKFRLAIGSDVMEVVITQTTPTKDDPFTRQPRRKKVRPSPEQAALAIIELNHNLYDESVVSKF